LKFSRISHDSAISGMRIYHLYGAPLFTFFFHQDVCDVSISSRRPLIVTYISVLLPRLVDAVTKRMLDRILENPLSVHSRYSFRLRHWNDYVYCGKMPAESSSHVQRRDNVVTLPILFFLSSRLSCTLAFIPSRFFHSSLDRLFTPSSPPRLYPKCKEQKEGARAQRSHAAQIEAAR